MSSEPRLIPCSTSEIATRLAELADAGMAFLGRDLLVEPIPMISARFARAKTRLFAVPGRAGLVGITPLNVYQAAIDVALPDATGYADVIATALKLSATHLGLRTVVRYEPNRDDRAVHFEHAGLRLLGVLRGARFQDGAYHDQRVWIGVTG
ncbi:hypothetical protein LWC34_10255 [Kibdelosporangium philippinense]|uniref:GNAT family N-acetyltransferase n=1 Tax=Kibdelosporangium philippinense TaxID=211113 RepID=A0ABS8Z5T4_9PSEU|nr:hypothetical protein [Kibdelosporangium philippinense]MCE7003210.1 hypothetical protein [Kibdelosporangium philippinense]